MSDQSNSRAVLRKGIRIVKNEPEGELRIDDVYENNLGQDEAETLCWIMSEDRKDLISSLIDSVEPTEEGIDELRAIVARAQDKMDALQGR